jgi:hypothetical protein
LAQAQFGFFNSGGDEFVHDPFYFHMILQSFQLFGSYLVFGASFFICHDLQVVDPDKKDPGFSPISCP